jgi:hypothetical protein
LSGIYQDIGGFGPKIRGIVNVAWITRKQGILKEIDWIALDLQPMWLKLRSWQLSKSPRTKLAFEGDPMSAIGIVIEAAMRTKLLDVDSTPAARAVTPKFCVGSLAADEKIVSENCVIKRFAGVIAETITCFDHRIMQDDVSMAEPMEFEAAVAEIEHYVANEVIRAAQAWLRTNAHETIGDAIAHHTAIA